LPGCIPVKVFGAICLPGRLARCAKRISRKATYFVNESFNEENGVLSTEGDERDFSDAENSDTSSSLGKYS
jgi:hypothetical protein